MSRVFATLVRFYQHFGHASTRANQLHGLRIDQRRGNSGTDGQCKPHQHEAGETVSIAQGLHGSDYHRIIDCKAVQKVGSYGTSVDCGVDIPNARLHAAPQAPRYLVCQEKLKK
jgi:hypothetical protein